MADLAQRGPLGQKAPKPDKPQRKGVKPVSAKRKARKASPEGQAGKLHMARVKMLPCVICGATPCDAHHVICNRYSARKASDFETIPLCVAHHRYPYQDAIHTDKAAWVEKYGPDHGYLAYVAEMLRETY